MFLTTFLSGAYAWQFVNLCSNMPMSARRKFSVALSRRFGPAQEAIWTGSLSGKTLKANMQAKEVELILENRGKSPQKSPFLLVRVSRGL